MNETERDRIAELTLKSLEGQISEEEFKELDTYISASNENARYFTKCIATSMEIMEHHETIRDKVCLSNESFDQELWDKLEAHEKTAPTIEISKEVPRRELIQKVVYPYREKQKMTKFQLFTLIASVAAVLCVIAFLKMFPEKPNSVEAASLVDQIDVQWGHTHGDFEIGDRLWTNEPPLILEKGFVSILYDNGVQVLIESPAKFEIERAGLFLEYGRLFSRVPKTGLGFRVETATCQFVDLGTEFGVQADVDGSSELHVIKGGVQLFAPGGKSDKTSQIIRENNAVRFDAGSGQVKTVGLQKTAFVRKMDSKTDAVWRGQISVDLADVVGGGNGFGTGRMGYGFHPATGSQVERNVSGTYKCQGEYVPVTSSDFIDGIFVPDGNKEQRQVISTGGHLFVECPDTSGTCPSYIVNHVNDIIYNEGRRTCKPRLYDIVYGTRERPCIYLHSNAGITFDLNAIRKSLPGVRVKCFKSICGIPQDNPRPNARSNVYVLIDGQLRFYREGLTANDGGVQIQIPINESDQFLTLLVTENDDLIGFDLILFAKPVLELEEI